MDEYIHSRAICDNPYRDDLQKFDGWVYTRTHMVQNHLVEISKCGPVKLVTSGSDGCAGDSVADRLPDNVTAWHTTNAAGEHPKIKPMPLGFISDSLRMDALYLAQGLTGTHRNLLYVNHTVYHDNMYPYARERRALRLRFSLKKWATVEGGISHNDVPAYQFYCQMRCHDYVVAPEGAGPDTHRLWEALALGCIPIVKRSPVHRAWAHLPILFVDDWQEVTELRLETELDSLRAKQKINYPELTLKHWGVPCQRT